MPNQIVTLCANVALKIKGLSCLNLGDPDVLTLLIYGRDLEVDTAYPARCRIKLIDDLLKKLIIRYPHNSHFLRIKEALHLLAVFAISMQIREKMQRDWIGQKRALFNVIDNPYYPYYLIRKDIEDLCEFDKYSADIFRREVDNRRNELLVIENKINQEYALRHPGKKIYTSLDLLGESSSIRIPWNTPTIESN